MPNTRLSEEEVLERLKLCEDPAIVDEVYTFGQTLEKETIDQIRTVESKATSFAAYGAAIVTLLVSSSSIWSGLGNRWSAWIAVFAGVCGLLCTYFSVRAMSLKEFECISEDEWLKPECLSKIEMLKKYRILTIWGTISSHGRVQDDKAKNLQRAQVWLTGAVIYLVYLLLHVAFFRSFDDVLKANSWIALRQFVINNPLGIASWQNLLCSPGALSGLCGALILGLTLALLVWYSRRYSRRVA
jgi:hypothetical protein